MRSYAVLLALLVSRIALAQVILNPEQQVTDFLGSFGDDVVTLRDGTIMRGRVVKMRPGDQLELQLIDGTTQIVQWADIAGTRGPSFPRELTQQNRVARYLNPSPGRVPVIVESTREPLTIGVLRTRPLIGQESMTFDEDGDLSQVAIDSQSRSGVVVCTATPCRIYARPGELLLQSSGIGVLSGTSAITVPPAGARVRLRAASVGRRKLGTLLLTIGLNGLIGGTLLTIFGAAFQPDPYELMMNPGSDHSAIYYGIGGALLGVGTALTVSGITLFAVNRPGLVSISPLGNSDTVQAH